MSLPNRNPVISQFQVLNCNDLFLRNKDKSKKYLFRRKVHILSLNIEIAVGKQIGIPCKILCTFKSQNPNIADFYRHKQKGNQRFSIFRLLFYYQGQFTHSLSSAAIIKKSLIIAPFLLLQLFVRAIPHPFPLRFFTSYI